MARYLWGKLFFFMVRIIDLWEYRSITQTTTWMQCWGPFSSAIIKQFAFVATCLCLYFQRYWLKFKYPIESRHRVHRVGVYSDLTPWRLLLNIMLCLLLSVSLSIFYDRWTSALKQVRFMFYLVTLYKAYHNILCLQKHWYYLSLHYAGYNSNLVIQYFFVCFLSSFFALATPSASRR